MKKLALGLAMVLCLGLYGCGGEGAKSPKEVVAEQAIDQAEAVMSEVGEDIKDSEAKEAELLKKNTVKVKNGTIDVGGAELTLKSYAIMDGILDGDKVIVLTFDFTNKDSEDRAFSNVYINAYQDGAELSRGYTRFEKDVSTQMKSGKTVEVITAYNLRNTESDIEFDFHMYHGGEQLDQHTEASHILKIK